MIEVIESAPALAQFLDCMVSGLDFMYILRHFLGHNAGEKFTTTTQIL